MRVVVTGGCGFIGSNFIRLLDKNIEVINIDNLTYASNKERLGSFYQNDICSNVANLLEGADYIFNFAAESHVDNSIKNSAPFVKTNVLGTHNLLEIARKNKRLKAFVQISTDEVYGSTIYPVNEGYNFNPSSPYSSSKASAELICRSYFKTFGMPIIITRSSNNFGPYQHSEKFIPVVINKLLRDEKIPVYGNGQNLRDWIYVEDNCKYIWEIAQQGIAGEAYNIKGEHELTNLQMIKIVSNVMGKTPDIEFVEDRLAHDFRYSISSAKIKELVKVKTAPFENAIQKTVDWYKDVRP